MENIFKFKCYAFHRYFHQQVSEVQDAAAGCSRSEGLECNQIPRSDRLHDMLDKYVENNSNHCKFWIVSFYIAYSFKAK